MSEDARPSGRPRVFVARNIPAIGLQMLRAVAEVRVHDGPLPPTRKELLDGVRGCHGILSLLSDRIDADVLDAAGEQLSVVSNFAVGYNNIDVELLRSRGVRVGNTPEVLTDATADIAVALMLAAGRCFRAGIDDVRQGGWQTWEPLGWIGQDFRNKTLGVVGMGRIGTAVAQRLHGGWNMRVLYTARSAKPEVDHELAAERVELPQLLRDSDFVSLHVPLSETTRHLISRRELQCMKSTAVLVNTSRGEVVDQTALANALRQHTIFAAGLDVWPAPEPLPLSDPLLELPNCIVLPHVGSATVAARDAMAERAANNVIAGLRHQPLPYPV